MPLKLEKVSIEQKMSQDNLILLTHSGSHLYGTNTPTSDKDYIGVFIPDKSYVSGLKNIEQIEYRTNKSDSGSKNTANDSDCTLYALKKYIQLLVFKASPNILETLFTPENCIIEINGFGRRLLENRELFISSQTYDSFRGFAYAQVRRLHTKNENGTGRVELQKQFGYDTKLAYNCIRLYIELTQFLKEGQITFPLKQNNLLLDIKNGKVSFDEFMSLEKKYSDMCDLVYANSKLPGKPDIEKVDRFLQELQEEFWNK